MALFGNSDEFIVSALFEGKNVEKATRKLYKKYWNSLIAFVINIGAKPSNADDYAQESILLLLHKIQKSGFDLTGPASLKVYLFAIAKHYTWNQIKLDAKKKSAEDEFAVESIQSQIEVKEEEWMEWTEGESAWKKFSRLGEGCQKLLSLFLAGNNSKQVQDVLGISSEGNVRIQKQRCLRKLLNL